jgi:hypothetical protein
VSTPELVDLVIEERPDPDAPFGGGFGDRVDDGPDLFDGPDGVEPMP